MGNKTGKRKEEEEYRGTNTPSASMQRRYTRDPYKNLQLTYQVPPQLACPAQYTGIQHLNNPAANKALGFTAAERQVLGIQGLLPPVIRSLEFRATQCMHVLRKIPDNNDKFAFLMQTLRHCERLFFLLMDRHVELLMPIIGTPTVGTFCLNYGLLYHGDPGMWIAAHDRGHVWDIVCNWDEMDVRVVVATNGGRIMGLGDMGAHAAPTARSKTMLYTIAGRIKPHQLLPVQIDVGTDNLNLQTEPTYLGLRQRRVPRAELFELMDEFMEAVARRWGPTTFVHLINFGTGEALDLLERYATTYCVLNNVQVVGAVGAAGLLAALRVMKVQLNHLNILFVGAGQVSLGLAAQCVRIMQVEGISEEEAIERIWMMDSNGLLTVNRMDEIKCSHKRRYLKMMVEEDGMSRIRLSIVGRMPRVATRNVVEVVRNVRPGILIGACNQCGIFSAMVLREMAKNHRTPLVFALSSPSDKVECTPQAAFDATDGACLYASSIYFVPTPFGGFTYHTTPLSTKYIFSAIALAAICGRFHHIPDEMITTASFLLADEVLDEELIYRSLFPLLPRLRTTTFNVAVKLLEWAYTHAVATFMPEPSNKEAFVRSHMYDLGFEFNLPSTYPWRGDE